LKEKRSKTSVGDVLEAQGNDGSYRKGKGENSRRQELKTQQA